MTRRFLASLAALTAAIVLSAANPAAAGLADRADTATSGEIASAPAKEPRATTVVAALQSATPETVGSTERPATVKRAAPAAKPAFSRRAEQPAKKEYRPRAAAPVWAAVSATPVRAAALGANCHRR